MRKGFTLVELSIVLVIIGLLIGGLLVAQSMISTAKLQGIIRQLAQFDAAVSNFQTKYNQLPGDSSLFGTVPGNNDGLIKDGYNYSNPASAAFNGELAHFWSDLSINGLISPGGTPYADGSDGSGSIATSPAKYLPLAVMGKNAYFVAFGFPSLFGTQVAGSNWYDISQMLAGSAISSIITGMAFTPTEAYSLDIKIDDGNPHNGNVIGSDFNGLVTSQSAQSATSCAGANLGVYNLAQSSINCYIEVRMGLSTNVLK